MSAPLEDWWTCCGGEGKECSREVNSKLFGNSCPDCQHERCDSCGEIRRPSPVPEDGFLRQYTYNLNNLHLFEAGQGPREGYGPQNIYGHSLHQVECPRRPPSMRGWWHCCQCGSDNNPETTGNTCPVCEHVKCRNGCSAHER